MKYQIVLSDMGKKAFVGGNVEAMQKVLVTFEAASERRAIKKFNAIIIAALGYGSAWLFVLHEVRQ